MKPNYVWPENKDDWEGAFFEDCRRADREDALAWEEEAKKRGLTLEELFEKGRK